MSYLQRGSISDYDSLMQGFEFTPVIEPNHPGAFITEQMYGVVEEGRMNRVPLLIGVASEEMLGRAQCKYGKLQIIKVSVLKNKFLLFVCIL